MNHNQSAFQGRVGVAGEAHQSGGAVDWQREEEHLLGVHKGVGAHLAAGGHLRRLFPGARQLRRPKLLA